MAPLYRRARRWVRYAAVDRPAALVRRHHRHLWGVLSGFHPDSASTAAQPFCQSPRAYRQPGGQLRPHALQRRFAVAERHELHLAGPAHQPERPQGSDRLGSGLPPPAAVDGARRPRRTALLPGAHSPPLLRRVLGFAQHEGPVRRGGNAGLFHHGLVRQFAARRFQVLQGLAATGQRAGSSRAIASHGGAVDPIR